MTDINFFRKHLMYSGNKPIHMNNTKVPTILNLYFISLYSKVKETEILSTEGIHSTFCLTVVKHVIHKNFR